jgi:hypothetical protein
MPSAVSTSPTEVLTVGEAAAGWRWLRRGTPGQHAAWEAIALIKAEVAEGARAPSERHAQTSK